MLKAIMAVDDDDGVFLPFDAERIIDGNIVKADIVLLRISHVNMKTYQFFRSSYLMENSNGNPFSEPITITDMLSNFANPPIIA